MTRHEYPISMITGRGSVFTFAEEVNSKCAEGWKVHTVLSEEGNERYKILFEKAIDE